jgi:two-component system, NtrC family, response regulator HydG
MIPVRASHVLLVDDEVRFVSNLARLLERHGFAVSTAFDGPQAIEALDSAKPIDVVVMDVRMPGLDGIQTLGIIKRLRSDLEVIMLTGQACLDDGIEAVRAGAFDYLQKPCDIEDLISRIKAACNVESIRRRPVLWPRSQAGEIMLSGFMPLFMEDKPVRAVEIFNRYREGEGGHRLFVVDGGHNLRGTVTRRDLLNICLDAPQGPVTWEWVRKHIQSLPDIPLSQIMKPEVVTVSPETPLAEAARRMLEAHYDSVPVVAGGCIKGVIRLTDVLRFLKAQEDER